MAIDCLLRATKFEADDARWGVFPDQLPQLFIFSCGPRLVVIIRSLGHDEASGFQFERSIFFPRTPRATRPWLILALLLLTWPLAVRPFSRIAWLNHIAVRLPRLFHWLDSLAHH